MMKQTIVLALAGVWLAHAGFAVADEPFFMGLGHLEGYEWGSYAHRISADGQVVVGKSSTQSEGSMPFRWTLEEGLTPLGWLPGGNSGTAHGVSGDGSVIVGWGKSYNTPDDTDWEAFKWTAETGMVGLGDLPSSPFESRAYDVTADGSTVVGYGTTRYVVPIRKAVGWAGDDPPEDLGALPCELPQSSATAVSADGSVIVGWSRNESYQQEAFILTDEGGMVGLGNLEGTTYHGSLAWDVAANAEVVVGESYVTGGYEAFRWTEETGMVGLGDLPGGIYGGQAHAVSADGSVVVGSSSGDPGGAFIWDEQHGMRALQDVLVQEYGLQFDGWSSLGTAYGISDDGLTIVGTGFSNGIHEGWIAHIPEPASLVYLLLGAMVVSRKPRSMR